MYNAPKLNPHGCAILQSMQSNLAIPNSIHVTFNLFGTAFTLFSFLLNFSAKKFGKPKMFDVSLHRHLKKKGAHDEHSTHTL